MLQFYKFSSLFISFEREDDKSDTHLNGAILASKSHSLNLAWKMEWVSQ